MIEKAFAKRLSELRMLKNVSAREMSLAIGQNQGYIHNIENGNNLPSMMAFFYICDYLEITPMDFFDFDAHNPKKLSSLYDDLKSLNDEQLEIIYSMVKNLKAR